MRSAALALLALATAPAGAADRSVTHIAVTGMAPTGWFLCDVLNAPAAVFVGRPGPDHKASIAVLAKGTSAPPVVKMYGIGRADPGAGQIYWPLERYGRDAGNLHAFNPGMYDPAAVTSPSFTAMRLGTVDYRCRWLAHTRLIGIGMKHSYAITQRPDGTLRFERFDYGAGRAAILQPDGVQQTTKPAQRIDDGRESGDGKGGTLLNFGQRGVAYVVRLPAQGQASVEVKRGGAVLREPLLAWTFAPN